MTQIRRQSKNIQGARAHHAFAADLGHTSVFPSLVVGGTLVVVPREVAMDPTALAALLDYLPVPREAKAEANRFAPRGRLLDASLVWTGESPAAATAWRGGAAG